MNLRRRALRGQRGARRQRVARAGDLAQQLDGTSPAGSCAGPSTSFALGRGPNGRGGGDVVRPLGAADVRRAGVRVAPRALAFDEAKG